MKRDLTAMALHLIMGFVLGYVSFLLNAPLLSLIIVLFIAIGMRYISKFVFKNREFGWWIGNGFLVYFFVWLITWIVLYNM